MIEERVLSAVGGGTSGTAVEDGVSWQVAAIERELRAAAASIGDSSNDDVEAARARLSDLEQHLAGIAELAAGSPAAPRLAALRDLLSSHLLAVSACVKADLPPRVSAKLLRRAARTASDAARLVEPGANGR